LLKCFDFFKKENEKIWQKEKKEVILQPISPWRLK